MPLNRLLDNELFKTIFNNTPGGVSIVTDLSCKEIIHNPINAEFLRIKAWESLAFPSDNSSLKVFNAEGKELTPEEMPFQRSARKGEELNGIELEFVWPDGVKKTGLWSTRLLKDTNFQTVGVVASCEDITHHKKAEDRNHLVVKNRLNAELTTMNRLHKISTLFVN